MSPAERLRRLDRRAEAFGKRFQREYDAPPPPWLKHAWVLVLLGPLTFPLSIVFGAGTSLAVTAVILVTYVAVALRWTAKHRVSKDADVTG
jgi:hypothetical protein